VPKASNIGCYVADEEIQCDMDMSSERIRSLVKPMQDLPDLHDREMESDAEEIKQDISAKYQIKDTSLQKMSSEQSIDIDYDTFSLARDVAYLFRIFVAPGAITLGIKQSSLLEVGTEKKKFWELDTARVTTKAKVLVGQAVAKFKDKQAKDAMETWFGPGCSESQQSRDSLQHVLNSVNNLLDNVVFTYPGKKCTSSTFAYVYARRKGLFSPVLEQCPGIVPEDDEECIKNSEGKYIVHLCQKYMNSPHEIRVETLVHEASHHAVAYEADVCTNEFYHGGEKTVYMTIPAGDNNIGDIVWVDYPSTDKFETFGGQVMSQIWEKTSERTVVKLVSKKADGCGEADAHRAYGHTRCADLARLSSELAMRNADNVCYYVSQVAAGGGSPSCTKIGDLCVGDKVSYRSSQVLTDPDGIEINKGDVGRVLYMSFESGEALEVRNTANENWQAGIASQDGVKVQVPGYAEATWPEVRLPGGRSPTLLTIRFDKSFLPMRVPVSKIKPCTHIMFSLFWSCK